MRVLFITSSESLSGGARQALYLAQGLSGLGHEVFFFAPETAPVQDLDIKINLNPLPASRNEWRSAVATALPKDSPCVVHAFHNKAVKKLAWWGLSWRGKGVVALGHRGVVYRPNNPLPYWSPGISCFTVNSEACKRVLRGLGVSEKRLAVVYNGVPAERVTPKISASKMRETLKLPDYDLVLGSIAGDKPVKGVEYLLRAFANLKADARLVLVGARWERWKDLHRELGLGERVIYAGRVECVADYLQLFDVFVLPSLSESMPNALLEAVCFGLPVVATRVGGVPEMVQDNGLLVPAKDAPALETALLQLCADEKQRKTFAQASRKLAGRFTMENKVNQTLEIYKRILAQRGLAE